VKTWSSGLSDEFREDFTRNFAESVILRLVDRDGCIAEVVIDVTVIQNGTAYGKILSGTLHVSHLYQQILQVGDKINAYCYLDDYVPIAGGDA